MAVNPMQKKARNSMLIGIIIGLLIGCIGIAFFFMQATNYKKQIKEAESNKSKAYVLNQDVKSGDIITANMFTQLNNIDKRTIPQDALIVDDLDGYSLVDSEGNEILKQDLNKKRVIDNGQTIELLLDKNTGTYYKETNGTREDTDFTGYYMEKEGQNGEIQTVLIRQTRDTGRYYIMNGTEREFIEFKNVPVIAKLNMSANTILTPSFITKSNERITSDLREQQYNMVILPQYLDIDNYIDIRLQLPNGQDYIVASKKRIKQISEDTIWIDMYEEETLAMTNAIVEAYKMKGAKLYATTYVEAGNQENAIPTYVPSAEVINLINSDSNITSKAREELSARYTEELRARRQDINAQVNAVGEQAQSNLESGIEQEITKAKENRKEYLDSLNVAE